MARSAISKQGRNAPVDLRSYARSFTALGVQVLVGIARKSKQDAVRVQAVALLLERGWGKAQGDVADQTEMRVVIRHIVENDIGGGGPSPRVIDHVPSPEPEPDPFA